MTSTTKITINITKPNPSEAISHELSEIYKTKTFLDKHGFELFGVFDEGKQIGWQTHFEGEMSPIYSHKAMPKIWYRKQFCKSLTLETPSGNDPQLPFENMKEIAKAVVERKRFNK